MIIVKTPLDKDFNYAECEELFEENRDKIQEVRSFDEVLKTSMFYSFYIWKNAELIGCIYYTEKQGKLFVTVFAKRHHRELNLECFKESLTWFKKDIYAEAIHKTSRIGALQCGFERIKGNLFIYRRQK